MHWLPIWRLWCVEMVFDNHYESQILPRWQKVITDVSKSPQTTSYRNEVHILRVLFKYSLGVTRTWSLGFVCNLFSLPRVTVWFSVLGAACGLLWEFIPKLSGIHDESKEDSDIDSGSLVDSYSLIWIHVEMSLSSQIRSAVSLVMS